MGTDAGRGVDLVQPSIRYSANTESGYHILGIAKT